MTGELLTVRVLKYDGSEYRRWNAQVARQDDTLLVLDAKFEFDVTHDSLGTIPRGTKTVEYYWFDRWFNVFEFLKDDGSTRLFYCNINTPASLDKGVLSYIDLDIDVLVQPDFSYQTLDLEEFEENASRYGYSDEVRHEAELAVNEVKRMIEDRQFPFSK